MGLSSLNPLKVVKRVTDAVFYPFKMIFVVGLCYFINWFTSPGHWWAHWVLFGMTIGLFVTWYRAFKALALTIGIAAIGYFFYRWWQNRQKMNSAQAGETALIEVQQRAANATA